MHRYNTIGRALIFLPIISFAFALPISVRETPKVGDDVVPDVAITMAKRLDKMEEQWGMYFERLSGKPESDLEGLKGLLHYGPELTKSPSFDHYLASESLQKSPSFDHFLASPEPSKSPPLDHHVMSTDSEGGPSRSAASESGWSMTNSPMEVPESKSFLSKVASKVKFWRRISGTGTVTDAMNGAQRVSQGLVDTEATIIRGVSPTPVTRDVHCPASGKSQEISVV